MHSTKHKFGYRDLSHTPLHARRLVYNREKGKKILRRLGVVYIMSCAMRTKHVASTDCSNVAHASKSCSCRHGAPPDMVRHKILKKMFVLQLG